ncbi:site-2 protease family protein [Gaetbulibacter aestuarii]|uniref:Zinc metalloprotease n=1 Tax=Gaetbulibacter aestuarii TaxID=1502358 RepID=A0ABW7MX13_9FLAO
MRANLQIGHIGGINILVHWTFIFLIIWIVVSELYRGGDATSILFNIIVLIGIFASIILHELGHALVAKRFHIQTEKITLLPIGGMASFKRMPKSPKKEFLVSMAGPLVNLIIAIFLYYSIPVKVYFQMNFTEAFEFLMNFSLSSFLFYLFAANAVLFIFNLIPAFPMDGGRMLRALLAMKMSRIKATRIATSVAHIIAVLFLFSGLLYNPFLVIIAIFIFFSAFAENQMVQQKALLKGHAVEEAMMINMTTLLPDDPIDIAVNHIIFGTEKNFIVVEDHQVKGILYHKDIIDNSNKNLSVKEVMKTKFQLLKYSDNLVDAYNLIVNKKNAFIPVMKDDKLAGVIDATNLNEFLLLQAKLAY